MKKKEMNRTSDAQVPEPAPYPFDTAMTGKDAGRGAVVDIQFTPGRGKIVEPQRVPRGLSSTQNKYR